MNKLNKIVFRSNVLLFATSSGSKTAPTSATTTTATRSAKAKSRRTLQRTTSSRWRQPSTSTSTNGPDQSWIESSTTQTTLARALGTSLPLRVSAAPLTSGLNVSWHFKFGTLCCLATFNGPLQILKYSKKISLKWLEEKAFCLPI